MYVDLLVKRLQAILFSWLLNVQRWPATGMKSKRYLAEVSGNGYFLTRALLCKALSLRYIF
jgi:hypothetical protein